MRDTAYSFFLVSEMAVQGKHVGAGMDGAKTAGHIVLSPAESLISFQVKMSHPW